MSERDPRRGGRESREGRRGRRRADPSSTLGGKLRAVEVRADQPPPELGKDKPGILERVRGAMLGLAVGDALGAQLEFSPRVVSPIERRDMIGGGPFGLEPGQWTDDTAMALALAKSLTLRKGFDPHDIMARFVSWYRTGEYSCTGTCFDIGGTTRAALERFERDGEPFQGSTAEHTAANGSLMRVAPAAIFGLDNEAEAIRIAREQSQLTHAHPACVDACGYFAQLLRLTLLGVDDPLVLALPRFEGHPDILKAKTTYWGGVERRHIKSGGYVAHTLESAFWACANAPSFEHAVTLAVNLGGDADTVGAVTGALAGARWGERVRTTYLYHGDARGFVSGFGAAAHRRPEPAGREGELTHCIHLRERPPSTQRRPWKPNVAGSEADVARSTAGWAISIEGTSVPGRAATSGRCVRPASSRPLARHRMDGGSIRAIRLSSPLMLASRGPPPTAPSLQTRADPPL